MYLPQYAFCDLSLIYQHQNRVSPFFRRFHRLTVEEGGGGSGFTAFLHPHVFAQAVVDFLENPHQGPDAKIVIDCLPFREVMRQQSPASACFGLIKEGVEDLAIRNLARTPRFAACFGLWKQGSDLLPLCVR